MCVLLSWNQTDLKLVSMLKKIFPQYKVSNSKYHKLPCVHLVSCYLDVELMADHLHETGRCLCRHAASVLWWKLLYKGFGSCEV